MYQEFSPRVPVKEMVVVGGVLSEKCGEGVPFSRIQTAATWISRVHPDGVGR